MIAANVEKRKIKKRWEEELADKKRKEAWEMASKRSKTKTEKEINGSFWKGKRETIDDDDDDNEWNKLINEELRTEQKSYERAQKLHERVVAVVRERLEEKKEGQRNDSQKKWNESETDKSPYQ